MSFLPNDPKTRQSYLMGMRIAGDFGIVIAIPIVVFVIIGQKLDAHYGTSPKLTILAFVLAALLSARIIYKKTTVYSKEYKDIFKKQKTEEKK